jgi:UDP-MurNAc hydroxylase
MLAAIKEWWEPLLRRARTIRTGVGGNVRFRIGELDMVVDFPKAKVREYAGEECIYWYTIPADLVSTNIADHEIDWSNSIFLSMQFEVGRSGQVQRVPHDVPEVPVARPHRVRRELVRGAVGSDRGCRDRRLDRAAPLPAPARRPHQDRQDRGRRAHLRPARLEVGPRVGQCLTTPGHPIRASRVVETASAAA